MKITLLQISVCIQHVTGNVKSFHNATEIVHQIEMPHILK